MRTTLIVVMTVGMFAAPAFAQSKGAQGTKDRAGSAARCHRSWHCGYRKIRQAASCAAERASL